MISKFYYLQSQSSTWGDKNQMSTEILWDLVPFGFGSSDQMRWSFQSIALVWFIKLLQSVQETRHVSCPRMTLLIRHTELCGMNASIHCMDQDTNEPITRHIQAPIAYPATRPYVCQFENYQCPYPCRASSPEGSRLVCLQKPCGQRGLSR